MITGYRITDLLELTDPQVNDVIPVVDTERNQLKQLKLKSLFGFITSSAGDMQKSTYDSNDNGIVDQAEAVEWNGVLNKPDLVVDSAYVHTDNNFTNEDKTKLDSIVVPIDCVVDSEYTHTDNNFTNEDKTKLDAIIYPAEVDLTNDVILTNKTIDSMTNKIGADNLHYKAKNQTGSMIPKGTLVKSVGYELGEEAVRIAPISSTNDVSIGMTKENILTDSYGLVINTGTISDINTQDYPVSTILYNAGNGFLTAIKPSSQYYQACAVVLRQQQNNGVLLVEFTEPSKNIMKEVIMSSSEQTIFAVSFQLSVPMVFVNGLLRNDYSIQTNSITFNSGLTLNDEVTIIQH